MSISQINTSEKRESWGATLTVLILFIISGLDMIVSEIPHEYAFPSPFTNFNWILLSVQFVLFSVLLCIGWIKGFPRWAYPYVAQFLLFTLLMSNTSTPGFLFGRELWRWRAWVPLLIVCMVALLVTRSFQPLLKFFTNIAEDWTLPTFGMFGCTPLIIMMCYDEMDRLYSLYFMVILVVLMIGTVILYMRSSTQKGRIITLLVGVFLTITTMVVGPAMYWAREMNRGPGPIDFIGLVIYLIMTAPMLLCCRPRRVLPTSKSDTHHLFE